MSQLEVTLLAVTLSAVNIPSFTMRDDSHADLQPRYHRGRS